MPPLLFLRLGSRRRGPLACSIPIWACNGSECFKADGVARHREEYIVRIYTRLGPQRGEYLSTSTNCRRASETTSATGPQRDPDAMNVDVVSAGEGGRGGNDIFGKISLRKSKDSETVADPEEIEVGSNRLEWQRREEK